MFSIKYRANCAKEHNKTKHGTMPCTVVCKNCRSGSDENGSFSAIHILHTGNQNITAVIQCKDLFTAYGNK